MAEVLSQNEIDALLSALSSGDIEADELQGGEEKLKVKYYDFKRPQKFSKDHIRTLELIHDNYARIITNYLTAQLRANVKVKVESVQQITYEEFIHSVPNTTVLTLFKMPPLNGQILLETNEEFVLRVFDVLAGGKGLKKPKLKELTDIEKNLIRHINEGLISNLKLAWEDVVEVFPEVETVETNPALNQTLAPNEPVALITFTVEMFGTNIFINICIPFLSLEKILHKLVMQYWFSEGDDELQRESREKLNSNLKKVSIELSALIGRTSISVGDFLNLEIGDVITLDNKCEDPIEVYVEEQLTYMAKPGLQGKNKAIQIIDYIDKDVENYE
ncbi:flagellar motor switch protein FliM [Clostridium punense]|uniref:Flagellar motor switch protein FliM n=1 Tax=Clostridium punense TaxID=1054297 RepID=A0ABS4K235_9CLOT|nr:MULTISPECIES: flagellar motor switch protein FliM [Clostridium]EQB88537.1 flagellar motor switch protein FliM [Clostridium sp. BL8]MBP2021839.1 flagellar motor switch protein FliM [Clostridium punense]